MTKLDSAHTHTSGGLITATEATEGRLTCRNFVYPTPFLNPLACVAYAEISKNLEKKWLEPEESKANHIKTSFEKCY